MEAASKKVEKKKVFKCFACGGSHPLFYCPKYLYSSREERWDFVKKEKICPLCLTERHSLLVCTDRLKRHFRLQKRTMMQCGQRISSAASNCLPHWKHDESRIDDRYSTLANAVETITVFPTVMSSFATRCLPKVTVSFTWKASTMMGNDWFVWNVWVSTLFPNSLPEFFSSLWCYELYCDFLLNLKWISSCKSGKELFCPCVLTKGGFSILLFF